MRSHLLSAGTSHLLWYPLIVHDQPSRLWGTLTHTTLHLLLSIFTVKADNWLGGSTYAGVRIRDGHSARILELKSRLVAVATYPFAHYLLLIGLQGGLHRDAAPLSMFMFLPMVFGSTSADLIGALLTKRVDLELKTDGAIQCSASVEGSLACWAASFVSCGLLASHPAFPASSAFATSLVALCGYVATVATVTEAAAKLFHGTRHGLMVVGVAGVLVACYDGARH